MGSDETTADLVACPRCPEIGSNQHGCLLCCPKGGLTGRPVPAELAAAYQLERPRYNEFEKRWIIQLRRRFGLDV